MTTDLEHNNKISGCLYGQAIGDALGLGTEFLSKDEVVRFYPQGLSRYEDIIQDHHRCRWQKGAWTDDTDMMLCIMTAFKNGEFDINQVAVNFKGWADGEPMGIGGHTFKVLAMSDYVDKPYACSELWWKLSRKQSAANGALMRTSVVGLAKNNVVSQSEKICKLTHYDSRCVGSCVIASLIIHNLVWENRNLSLTEIKSIANRYDTRIEEWVDIAFNSNDIVGLDLDETYSIGYTLRTLSAALWCYWHANSFEDGLLKIVNEGGDADTNAAISCAILGAKFGYKDIPTYYIENLHNTKKYSTLVDSFINELQNS